MFRDVFFTFVSREMRCMVIRTATGSGAKKNQAATLSRGRFRVYINSCYLPRESTKALNQPVQQQRSLQIMDDTVDKSKSFFPLAGCADDGWSNEDLATATCYCGAVQLSFPTQGPGFLRSTLCHCTDCRKITASMFSSLISIEDSYVKHIRGREKLSTYSQSRTTNSGKLMTNYFCSTCGTLMYRLSEAFPGRSFLRLGTVDDFHLHETKLKPTRETHVEDRVDWLCAIEGTGQVNTRLLMQQIPGESASLPRRSG
jgi:hypothetical protein